MEFEDEDDEEVVYSDSVKKIMQLFEDRDNAYMNDTQRIVDAIGPTVLEALYELFAVPVEQVRWLDFHSTPNLLVVVCSIGYTPSHHIPQFIADTSNNIPKTDKHVEQIVRVGVPYEIIMHDSVSIVDFLRAMVDSHKSDGPSLIEYTDVTIEEALDEDLTVRPQDRVVDQFDPHELTDDQRAQLLVFQHQTKGKIH